MDKIASAHRRTVALLGMGLLAAVVLSFSLGRYPVSPGEVVGILGAKLGLPVTPFWSAATEAAGKLGLYVLASGNPEIAPQVTVTGQQLQPGTKVQTGTMIELKFTDTGARD